MLAFVVDSEQIVAWLVASFEPVVLLALGVISILLYSGAKGHWVFGREHAEQTAHLSAEVVEWRRLAHIGMGIADKATTAVEERRP